MFRVLVALLAVAAHTVNGLNLPIARQDAASCAAPCTDLSNALSGGSSGGVAAICTNDIGSKYSSCYNCEVQTGATSKQAAQQIMDAYVDGCKAGGHPINSISITASGSGTADAGAGAGAAPVVSGASPVSSGGSQATSPPAKTGGARRNAAGTLGAALSLVYLAVKLTL
ncbi:hypothetical protein R3P38DRAFT_3576548 [Favolaschia claudopus]|uniref:Uncharacterized protein n=1 Tax=Favolaschia claudopus TaxID=2862362 RepID=A0AAW0DQN4_9AGAR